MMSTQALLKRGGAVLGSIGAAALLYQLLLRRSILNWGATEAEANARLPGDELLEDADGVATRAITIDAPASAVWPWITQMGPSPRGGAYTYDWIENLLGLDMHSANRVLPEYQQLQVGDTLGYGKNDRCAPRQRRLLEGALVPWWDGDGHAAWMPLVNVRQLARWRRKHANRGAEYLSITEVLGEDSFLERGPSSRCSARQNLQNGLFERSRRLTCAHENRKSLFSR
jgi:hypothetical protein